MRFHIIPACLAGALVTAASLPAALAQVPRAQSGAPADPIAILVGRLDLERYKATIKGLTQFGDRRQGTDRNRAAIDWIEAQLKSYGCTNTERLHYSLLAATRSRSRAGRRRAPRSAAPRARRRARLRGICARRPASTPIPCASPMRSCARSTSQPSAPGAARGSVLHQGRHDAPRRDVHRRRPHGRHGWGEAANDDGSGTALVMELARVFCSAGCEDRALDPLRRSGTTRRPARTARAPMSRSARRCRARRSPPGSGKYPEPSGSA